MSSEKKVEESEVERIYTISLSKAWDSPKWRRSIRVVNMIREFARKNMKSDEIRITPQVNETIWKRGIENPPRHITLKMVKDKEGVVTVSPAGDTK